MRHLSTSCHQALLTSLCLLLLLSTSCDRQVKHPPAAEARPTPSFRSVSYRLTRLDEPSFLDSLRALPPADSTLIKRLLVPSQRDAAFDSATAYRRYRTFPLGPYRAEVVAVISDFNTVSGSLQLLLFAKGNQWVSTVALASHADEAGATEDITSVQESPLVFQQIKVTTEVVETRLEQEGKPEQIIGVATTTIKNTLRFDRGRLTKTQLDSTYRLVKEGQPTTTEAPGEVKRP